MVRWPADARRTCWCWTPTRWRTSPPPGIHAVVRGGRLLDRAALDDLLEHQANRGGTGSRGGIAIILRAARSKRRAVRRPSRTVPLPNESFAARPFRRARSIRSGAAWMDDQAQCIEPPGASVAPPRTSRAGRHGCRCRACHCPTAGIGQVENSVLGDRCVQAQFDHGGIACDRYPAR